ncbi:hypothetical protein Sa4125_00380 [Aureimonas sp. SA4125]|uniref:hypothetical protein n=1 Tax=Aureimonas sp. SA4125 TaxID=2826993 RepID=UPI001CC4BFA2|nr:hypothetical protein [Aureimonas sp. SA4125]BDA82496.1 hypothetical protein Sa4125_00380 [Aureimonas sp. SA4125]
MISPPTDPLHALYEAVAARQAARPTAVRDLPADERRAYMREAKRTSRERQRAASADGSPLATDDAIRAALADAALMILATDAPGAAQIMSALAAAFTGRGGVPGTVRARCRSGSLRPTLIKPKRMAGEA